jgi:dipeptidyl aminopeptidase/acylaminoacyl peptidase
MKPRGWAAAGGPGGVGEAGTILQSGDFIYLIGAGSSPQGDRPFLDRFNLKTLASDRLFQSEGESYENIEAVLSSDGKTILTRYETVTTPPNYFFRNLTDHSKRALTEFKDPQPPLRGVERQFVTYKRKDGVGLSATLYLPPGYKKGTRLPVVMWAYPREFTDPGMAGQVSGSPYRFTTVSGPSHMLFLTQGYAVFDNPTMPIIGPGETANDTYVEQLVASAQAAVDKVVEMGVGDRDRIGVGGHSYGAFMTANLLAHSRLFRAGIARSGAYNRTLTPFGFQNERRTFWEVPQIYANMSPFYYARQGEGPDPAHPRRGRRQLGDFSDPVRAVLHGPEGSRRDGPLRHAAQRGTRLREPRDGPRRGRRDVQLVRQVREERSTARASGSRQLVARSRQSTVGGRQQAVTRASHAASNERRAKSNE